MDSGLYIAVFHFPQTRDITIGKLGTFNFQAGFYFYVGTAQRNLDARIERHGRQDKPLRWHIDYLSIHAYMLGAILIDGPRDRECDLATKLHDLYELAIPHFGASDCRCGGHLFYSETLSHQ